MNCQDIESVVQSASTSAGWSFSQVQLFALGNLGFYVGFDRRSCFTAKRGLGSVEITTGRNFKLDAWEYQSGLGLEYKVRYFKTFQSLLNYLKKIS
jgi:hypothetical protein